MNPFQEQYSKLDGRCGVYKYVYNDEIIYIGMSGTNIAKRISDHSKEPTFQPYLDECIIYYILLPNKAQAHGIEELLIDKYKPILNTQYVYDNGGDIDIELLCPAWIEYLQATKEDMKIINIHKIKIKGKEEYIDVYEACNNNNAACGLLKYVYHAIKRNNYITTCNGNYLVPYYKDVIEPYNFYTISLEKGRFRFKNIFAVQRSLLNNDIISPHDRPLFESQGTQLYIHVNKDFNYDSQEIQRHFMNLDEIWNFIKRYEKEYD